MSLNDVTIVIESEDFGISEISTADFETRHTINSSEVGPQGPPGPKGDPGDSAIDLAFQISNRFSEISEDEVAKQAARSNLGLSTIDGGTFF